MTERIRSKNKKQAAKMFFFAKSSGCDTSWQSAQVWNP